MRFSRRDALTQLGAAGAGLVVGRELLHGQTAPMVVAGRQVAIAAESISNTTVHITVRPLESGVRSTMPPTRAGDLRVRVADAPPAIHVETATGVAIQRLLLDRAAPTIRFSLGKGRLLGFGEGGQQFDRRGHSYTNRNGQGGYQLRTHGARVPVQWLMSTDGWGLFVRHPLGAFDLSGAEGVVTPAADALPLDIFITASPDPKVLLAEYARITGFAELPPLWAFGYMQSHRTLSGPDEVKAVARTFREKKLPCDALIYLGTEFTPSGWNTRNGEFGWKPENFPDPKAMLDELHAQRYKVVLHVVIEGRRMSGTVSDPCTPDKAVPSGRTADDRWPDDRAVPCYWPYHKPLYDLGVDGMWPDQGDGLDEASRLARIRMYWEGPQLYRPAERPFALHRNGYSGMQRYGAFLWSGDVYSTWETLKTHVPVAVNTGLSGIPYWGTDIGGFVPTPEYTGELHVRWFQFGTFCPLFRSHGRTWHLRLPWGWNTGSLGPEELRGYTGGAGHPDPSELRNAQVEPIIRKYLELRYRLLPYTYSLAKECCDTGLPMMRSLWLHYPDDPSAVARGDQFLWGKDMLVSPVVEKGVASRRLYLPRGEWHDYWTEERVAGGRELERAADLATMPLHVRAGAIIPHAPVRQYVDQPSDEPLTVVVYPGADGAFVLYEDDGRTFEHRKGAFMRIAMAWDDRAGRLSMRLAPGSRMLPPLTRQVRARLAGSKEEQSVRFDGKPVAITLSRK